MQIQGRIFEQRAKYVIYIVPMSYAENHSLQHQKFDQNAVKASIFITSAEPFRLQYHTSTCLVGAHVLWNASMYLSPIINCRIM